MAMKLVMCDALSKAMAVMMFLSNRISMNVYSSIIFSEQNAEYIVSCVGSQSFGLLFKTKNIEWWFL